MNMIPSSSSAFTPYSLEATPPPKCAAPEPVVKAVQPSSIKEVVEQARPEEMKSLNDTTYDLYDLEARIIEGARNIYKIQISHLERIKTQIENEHRLLASLGKSSSYGEAILKKITEDMNSAGEILARAEKEYEQNLATFKEKSYRAFAALAIEVQAEREGFSSISFVKDRSDVL